jgi:hypothetical protein
MAAEGRLLHHNWDLYDTRHTVFRPARSRPNLAYGWTMIVPAIPFRFALP